VLLVAVVDHLLAVELVVLRELERKAVMVGLVEVAYLQLQDCLLAAAAELVVLVQQVELMELVELVVLV
jgi:hypothetical protein